MSDWPEAPEADAWLWRVLQKEKNRLMIARLEDTLAAFLANPAELHLQFPPRSAFHRRVCFAVASRYRLDHRLDACPAGVSLVLIKTPTSAVPVDRLDAFATAPMPVETPSKPPPPQQKEERAPPATFLRRPDSDGRKLPIASSTAPNAASSAVRSITEEDYQKARARIFKPASQTQEVADIVKFPSIAKGPTPGSTGFERRRSSRAPEKRQVRRQCSNEDLRDPDFDRRYDKWAVRQPTPPAATNVAAATAATSATAASMPVFGQLLYPYPVAVHPAQVGMQMPVMFQREDVRGPTYGLDSTADFPPLQ